MANYALVSLASKLAFLQCNWRFDSVHSKSMMMAYESLMIEVGLYGNTMSHDYKKHSMLVTNNTWFKNVWELTSYFKVRLNFDDEFHLKAVRRGDKSLMAEFMRVGKFTQSDLVSLNIMRMHKKVVHTSDIVLCDGKTIKSEMLTDSPGHSDTHKFPIQRPSQADLILWRKALRMISSDFLVLTVPLQGYVLYPHNLPQWMINDDGSILHNTISMGDREYHEVYIPTSKPLARKTQSGQQFNCTMVVMGSSSLQNYASVTQSQPGHVLVHSSIPRFIPPPPVSGFEHAIKTFANQSLWTSLDYDGDGSWILGGMLSQSLVIIHDGSFMKEFSPTFAQRQK